MTQTLATPARKARPRGDRARRCARLAIVAASLTAAGTAGGATFQIADTAGAARIEMRGQILSGDDRQLAALLEHLRHESTVYISLTSNGGDVQAATTMGEMIAARGLSTIVEDNAICASSCGLIWLAGRTRYTSSSGHIGFHAAYDPATYQTAPWARPYLRAYLAQIGVNPSFIDYIDQRQIGEGMGWLTVAEADSYGIAMTVVDSRARGSAVASTDFVDATDRAAAAYRQGGREALVDALEARYRRLDAEPSLRAAFVCFAFELASSSADRRAAAAEGREADPTFAESAWVKRIIPRLENLGYSTAEATKIVNVWISSNNDTIAAEQ